MADTAAAPQGDATSRLVKSLQEFGRGMDPAELAAAAHPLALQEAQRLLVNAGDVVAWALRAQRQKATGKLHVARKPRASLVHLLVDAGCPRRGAEKMSYDEAVAMLGGNYFAQMLVDKARETDELLAAYAPKATGAQELEDDPNEAGSPTNLRQQRAEDKEARLSALRAEAQIHVSTVLEEKNPNRLEMPVCFAAAANDAFHAVRAGAERALRMLASALPGADAIDVHDEYAVKNTMVETCPPNLASRVRWRPPQDHIEMKETKLAMVKVQGDIMGKTQRGRHEESRQRENDLRRLCARQLEIYQGIVRAAQQNEARVCERLIGLVTDLSPRYARVYKAAGEMVRKQRSYAEFNGAEEAIFAAANRKPKPRQRVKKVYDLICAAAHAQPVFAESMRRVVRAVEASAQTAVPPLPLGGVVFSLGGIKKCPRIMEKLILDPGNPTAKPALDSLDPDGLDASGVRDIVRGMFICASMRHAVAVLEALRVNAEAGHFELVRSKNRFQRPSAGGWMDCLVNLRLRDNGMLCEVQIVDRLLLTVRAEWGAHRSYNTYRAASELLESVGRESELKRAMEVATHNSNADDGGGSSGSGTAASRGPALTSAEEQLPDWMLEDEPHAAGDARGAAQDEEAAESAAVRAIAVSLDSSIVAAAAEDGNLRIWGLQDGALRHCIDAAEVGGAISALAVTPDAQFVIAACADKAARAWSLKDGALVCAFSKHGGPVADLAVTPNGKFLITGSFDRTARVWSLDDPEDVRSGASTCLHTMRGHDGPVRAVAATPDSSMVVTGSDDTTAALWSLEDGFLVRDFKGHEDGIDALSITPDGLQLVTRSNDHTVRLWSLGDGALVHLFRGLGFVQAVAVAPGITGGIGPRLLTGGRDQCIRVLSLEDWALLQTCKDDGDHGAVHGIAVTSDGRHFVTGSRGLSVWSMNDGALVRHFQC